jgi:glycosyltransferase involved in cell wall biosynthesis
MKTIWIFNHYATNQYFDKSGRHYSLAKYLIREGYNVTIFAASSIHNNRYNLIYDKRRYIMKKSEGVTFVFIKTRDYRGNGRQRIFNILDYYFNLLKVTKFLYKGGGPDIIIGSSAHLLACFAALKISKKIKCNNIVEIRDLWPESFVAYGLIKKNNPLLKLMYAFEKYIYVQADKIIFTMEGGKNYISEKGWDNYHGGPIKIEKVYHINNGVDLEYFDYNKNHYKLQDNDLDDKSYFKVIYTGSIRLTNNLDILVQAAKKAHNMQMKEVKFIIYGEGDQRERLQEECYKACLTNIIFKGPVPKKYIPYILSKSSVNLLDMYSSPLFKYGISPNKLFDYFASGKPLISGMLCDFDLIKKNTCGIVLKETSPDALINAIKYLISINSSEYEKLAIASRRTAEEYNYAILAKKLINIINEDKPNVRQN